MARHPSAFGRFLCALDFSLGPVVEVAVIGAAPDAGAALRQEVFGRYLPNLVVAGRAAEDVGGGDGLPLLQGRTALGGRSTAFVCRNYACELPVTERQELSVQLQRASGGTGS